MSPEIRIRNRDTGQVFIGSGDIPDGYEVVTGPAGLSPRQQERFAPAGDINWKTIGAMIPPAIGAIGGGAIGGMLGNVPGAIAGEMAGSAGGTAFNQAVGLEPPSLKQIGLSAALGPAARLMGGLGRGAVAVGGKLLPGSSAARHQAAVDVMNGIPGLIRPAAPSAGLYAQVAKMNPNINTAPVEAVIDEIAKRNAVLTPGLKRDEVDMVIAGLKDAMYPKSLKPPAAPLIPPISGGTTPLGMFTPPPPVPKAPKPAPEMPFTDFWERMKALREKIESMGATKVIGTGELKHVRKAFLDTLEKATTDPGLTGVAASTLKAGNAMFRKEVAHDAVQEFITTKAIAARPGDNMMYVKPGAVMEWLRKDPDDIVRLLDPVERAGIEATMKKLARLPALPPPQGVNAGSFRLGANALVGGAAGLPFGPQGAAIGAAIATKGPQLISQALMTERGRHILLKVMDRGPFLDWPRFATLAIAMRAPLFGEEESPR